MRAALLLCVALVCATAGNAAPVVRPSGARAVVIPPMPVIRNATALSALRANSANATAVLFTPVGWAWCASCRALRNATDTIRRSLVLQQRQKHVPLRTDERTGKKLSKAERTRIAKLRASLPVDFAVFDCSGVPALAPGHPCTTEANGVFPTLALYPKGAAEATYLAPAPRGSATPNYADVLSVNKFLRASVPALKAFEAVEPPAAVKRPELAAVTSSLSRFRLEDIEEARSATADRHTVLLLHPAECLQCRDHFTAVEAVAAGAEGALADTVRFARTPLDSTIRGALSIASDGPVIAMISPNSASLLTTARPLVYTGPLTPHDLLDFIVATTRAAVPATLRTGELAGFARSEEPTAVAAQMRAVTTAPRAAAVIIDSASDIDDRLFASADSTAAGGRRKAAGNSRSGIDGIRFAFFGAHWAASTVRVATAVNAFAAAAKSFAEADTGIEAGFFLLDLTNPVVGAAVAADKRIAVDAAPFVTWCRASRCADDGMKPFEYAVTAHNLLSFVRFQVAEEVAAAQPSLAKTAVALDALVAPTAALGDSGETALRTARTTEELVDHVATLEPLAPTSEFDALRVRATGSSGSSNSATDDQGFDEDDDDEPGLVLPASYYDGVPNFYVLVTFHNTADARRESNRALERFKVAAARLRDERRVFTEFRRKSAVAAEEPPNATLVTIDGSRFSSLVYKWSQRSALSSQPFVVLIQRTGGDDGTPVTYDTGTVSFLTDGADASKSDPTAVIPDGESAAALLDGMLEAAGHPGRFDRFVKEVTPNSFVAEVLDETKGVLLMLRGKDCPHSLSMMPSFAEAASTFTKDQHQLTFATMDVEDISDDVKRDMAISHYPQLRWYAKGLANTPLAGELVDTTPYREALIEFVSEEMGFAHMDLQAPSDSGGVFADVTSKDFTEAIVNANDTAILLYVYSGRALSERRLDILRRVGWHFKNFTIGMLEGAEALAAYNRADPDELSSMLQQGGGSDTDDQAFDEDEDEPITPEDLEAHSGRSDGFGDAKAVRLNPPRTQEQLLKLKKKLAKQASKLSFHRMDAMRYRKIMTKHGFAALTERATLPSLVFLPSNVNKELGIKRYPADATFSELSIVKWALEQSKLDPTIENEFNYTDDEYANERDPPLVNVVDVDQSNFFEFMGDGADRVVLYYAQWCRHSQDYMPTFAKAAEHFAASADSENGVQFGRADVPNNAHIGHHQGIQSFPTVIVYFKGAKERALSQGVVFRGAKTATGLIEYVERIRGTSKVKKLDDAREKRLTRIKRLDDVSFTAEVEKKRNYSVVLEFSTTWCGHCRHAELLLADYAALQASLKHEVVVAKIDAEDFSKIAMTYNATANFPIIAIFPPLSDDPTRPGAKLPHKKYQDARFIRDMSDFFQGTDKKLTVTDAQHRSFEVDRDREDSFLIDTLTRKPGQAKKKKTIKANSDDDDVTASYDSDGEDAYGDGTGPSAVNADGSLRRKDGSRKQKDLPTMTGPDGETIEMPGADGVFQGFPETVQTLNEDSFRKAIDGTSVALVLHYATPGDEVIMTTFGVVADALGPAMKRGMLKLGALESGNAPSIVPFVGKAPTLTLFRGFAVPNQVRFNTAAGTALGDGGRLENETEVMAFVEKHLNHSRVTSLEISDSQFDKAVANASLTFAVFFYAPYCDECRPAAQAYDEVAQMLGHRTDIILTRIDISRQPRSYRMLGSTSLPTIAVYDGLPLDGSASIADRRPRFFDGTSRDRPSIHRFLTRGAATDEVADNVDDSDIITDEDLAGETDAAERARLREQAVEDREMRRKMELVTSSKPLIPLMIPTEGHLNLTLHDFPKGVLVFLTANWCPHCNAHLRTYASVVPAMQDLMAVASFDVSSAPGVLARFGVVSVPSYIFVSKSAGTHHVYGGRQKTAAAITKWALKFAPAKPDAELPLYSEVPEDYDWGLGGSGGGDADGDKAAKAKEEAKMFPATLIGSESAARRALEAAAADDRSDKRKSVSATVLFVRADACDTPRCAALVDNANRVASGLRHSEMIVGIVNVSFGGDLFNDLGATSLPSVHIRCGKYAVTKAVSSLAAPMKMSHGALKAKNRVAPDLNLIERVSTLVDTNCLARQALSVEDLSQARRALDADSMKEEAKLTLRHLPRQRAKESAVVFIRPRVCADRCDAYEAVWEAVLKAARKRTAGAEGAVDYVRVDLNEQGNKVLRKVLFQRRIEAPAFVYMPMDLTADPAAVVSGEPSVDLALDVVDALGRFVGELSADGLVDFIQRRHRKEHG